MKPDKKGKVIIKDNTKTIINTITFEYHYKDLFHKRTIYVQKGYIDGTEGSGETFKGIYAVLMCDRFEAKLKNDNVKYEKTVTINHNLN